MWELKNYEFPVVSNVIKSVLKFMEIRSAINIVDITGNDMIRATKGIINATTTMVSKVIMSTM
jgi:hypothetical protein